LLRGCDQSFELFPCPYFQTIIGLDPAAAGKTWRGGSCKS
jgi:hypothetical protein